MASCLQHKIDEAIEVSFRSGVLRSLDLNLVGLISEFNDTNCRLKIIAYTHIIEKLSRRLMESTECNIVKMIIQKTINSYKERIITLRNLRTSTPESSEFEDEDDTPDPPSVSKSEQPAVRRRAKCWIPGTPPSSTDEDEY